VASWLGDRCSTLASLTPDPIDLRHYSVWRCSVFAVKAAETLNRQDGVLSGRDELGLRADLHHDWDDLSHLGPVAQYFV
jgi:hypothetical protein